MLSPTFSRIVPRMKRVTGSKFFRSIEVERVGEKERKEKEKPVGSSFSKVHKKV